MMSLRTSSSDCAERLQAKRRLQIGSSLLGLIILAQALLTLRPIL